MKLPNQSAGANRDVSCGFSPIPSGIGQSQWSRFLPRPRETRIRSLIGTPGDGPVQSGVGETCTFTNDNIAVCDTFIWDCDPDGVCVQGGTLWTDCYDNNGNKIPCP